MEIIEDNYNEMPETQEIICSGCRSKLKITKGDSHDGKTVVCPLCSTHIKVWDVDTTKVPDINPPWTCSECGQVFTSEPYIGSDGSLFARCPCGSEEWVGEGIDLNTKNLEYPTHFYQYNNKKTVRVKDKEITRRVRECLSQLSRDNSFFFSGSGDSLVVACLTEEDVATVFVCRGYAECNISLKNI